MAEGTSHCKACGIEIQNRGGVGRKRLWCEDCKTLRSDPEFDPRRPGRNRRLLARKKLERSAAGLAPNGHPRARRTFFAGLCLACGNPFITRHARERTCGAECAHEWKAEKSRRKLYVRLGNDGRLERLAALTTDAH